MELTTPIKVFQFSAAFSSPTHPLSSPTHSHVDIQHASLCISVYCISISRVVEVQSLCLKKPIPPHCAVIIHNTHLKYMCLTCVSEHLYAYIATLVCAYASEHRQNVTFHYEQHLLVILFQFRNICCVSLNHQAIIVIMIGGLSPFCTGTDNDRIPLCIIHQGWVA